MRSEEGCRSCENEDGACNRQSGVNWLVGSWGYVECWSWTWMACTTEDVTGRGRTKWLMITKNRERKPYDDMREVSQVKCSMRLISNSSNPQRKDLSFGVLGKFPILREKVVVGSLWYRAVAKQSPAHE